MNKKINKGLGAKKHHPYLPVYPNGGRTHDNYSDLQPNGWIYGTSADYGMGGMMNQPSEVEGGETMQAPNGMTANFEGNKHENGGIKVNLPSGTDIYSDRIKFPGTKKSIADIAKKFPITKYQKQIDDPESDTIRKNSAELMLKKNNEALTNLFTIQETVKQDKMMTSMNRIYKKYGINDAENNTMGYGGRWGSAGVGAATGAASGAIAGAPVGGVGAPIGAIIGGLAGGISGYFSGASEEEAEKKQEELQKQQLLVQNPIQPMPTQGIYNDVNRQPFYGRNGGRIPKYGDGDTVPYNENLMGREDFNPIPEFYTEYNYTKPEESIVNQPIINNQRSLPGMGYLNDITKMDLPTVGPYNGGRTHLNKVSTAKDSYGNAFNNVPKNNPTMTRPNDLGKPSGITKDRLNTGLGIAQQAGEYLPAIWNLYQGLKPQDKLNSSDYMTKSNIPYRDLDMQPVMNNINAERNLAAKQSRIGSTGNYLSNLQNLSANTMTTKANALIEGQEYNNTNRFSVDQFNTQINQGNNAQKYAVDDWNMRSKADREAHLGEAASGISTILRGKRKDKQDDNMNYFKAAAVKDIYTNYNVNPEWMDMIQSGKLDFKNIGGEMYLFDKDTGNSIKLNKKLQFNYIPPTTLTNSSSTISNGNLKIKK